VAGELLLDTGALVSLLNRKEPLHERCREVLREWRRPIVSTEAVLTEATHLLGQIPGGRARCIEYFVRGAAILVPTTAGMLRRCRTLVEQYADVPMAYADATLVALAEELDTDFVFTTDRHDFGIYRVGDRRRFQILPG
jgi:predicted nucleic acid-binding protein